MITVPNSLDRTVVTIEPALWVVVLDGPTRTPDYVLANVRQERRVDRGGNR